MLRMILALLLPLVIVLLAGPKMIAELRKLKFGQTIYELGPAHQQKQGTPTMGGLLMVAGVVVAALVLHPAAWQGAWDFMPALIAVSVLTMLVGFLDDYIKVVKKRNLGLTPMQKIAGQVVVALAFSTYCYFNPAVGSSVIIPFFQVEWNLGIFYIPLMTLLIIFISNSANLQDGLDGLLSTVTCVGSIGWAIIALAAGLTAEAAMHTQYQSVAIFALALVGATMGFLRFNYYPAKVFMGDTGSMFIGGAMVGIAMLLRQPFMLLFLCFTSIMSSVSVMMQVTYFKYTKKKYGAGRRIFKMSPIHHHFEKCGMTETQIDTMYAIVTGVLTLIAALSVLPLAM